MLFQIVSWLCRIAIKISGTNFPGIFGDFTKWRLVKVPQCGGLEVGQEHTVTFHNLESLSVLYHPIYPLIMLALIKKQGQWISLFCITQSDVSAVVFTCVMKGSVNTLPCKYLKDHHSKAEDQA